MKTKVPTKVMSCLLSLAFFLMTGGYPCMSAAATMEINPPIGQMISRGVVKFEARENVWKSVESSLFPIFRGSKMRTEKGTAAITLSDNSQIEIGPNSLFSFDQKGRFILSQGQIEFRFPPGAEVDLEAGGLFIVKCRTLHATTAYSSAPDKNEEIAGSISIHSNGAVSLKSANGRISLLNKDRVVLTTLSPKETVTVPSVKAGGKEKTLVAQVGGDPKPEAKAVPEESAPEKPTGYVGLASSALAVGMAVGIAGVAGIGIAGASDDDGQDFAPICR